MAHAIPQAMNVIAAWRGASMRERTDWIYDLTAADREDLDAALAGVRTRGLDIPAIGKKDFPLPRLGPSLQQLLHGLEVGRGFCLLRGLPIERYSKQDAGVIFWGIGQHLGRAVAQNAQGDVLGHVRDMGRDGRRDMHARGYQTRMHLPFHNDSSDVVGLMCLRTAKSGGLSSIVSSVAVHDEMLRLRPDLAKLLYEPFCVDRRGEEAPGDRPYYLTPIFNPHRGRLFNRFNRSYIISAQRFPEVPRLTAAQNEALDMVDSLCRSNEFRLDMELRPGDIQFVNNYVVLHSRTEYEDYEEPDIKRHLLRLWLFTPGLMDRPPALSDRFRDMEAWQAHPRPPSYHFVDMQEAATH